MMIEHCGTGAKITIDADEANEWALDECEIPTSDISEQLQDMGFGKQQYEVEGSIDCTISFIVRVVATSEDEAGDMVRDAVDIDEYAVAQAFDCHVYEGESELGDVNCGSGYVEIDSVSTV